MGGINLSPSLFMRGFKSIVQVVRTANGFLDRHPILIRWCRLRLRGAHQYRSGLQLVQILNIVVKHF